MKKNYRTTALPAPKTISRSTLPPQKPQNTVKIGPLPPEPGLDVWITAKQACGILGIKGATIYRLMDAEKPFLITRRPLPRKVLISLRSVEAFAEATKDPLFWESPDLQAAHQRRLREMGVN